MEDTFLSARAKVAASIALLATAAGAASLGTYGSFTSSVNASTTFSAGTVVIGLGDDGTSDNRLSVNASGITPGDTVQRAVTVLNQGSEDFASISLDTVATTSSKLDTDGTNGLQMTIQSCPTAWTETAAGAGYTYTCSGGATTVVASQAVIGTNIALPSLAALTHGQPSYLVVSETLPTSADNSFANLTSAIKYTFTATQRGGTSK